MKFTSTSQGKTYETLSGILKTWPHHGSQAGLEPLA